MADIFISYKREDRARIEPLARALEARGYTVWWDPELVAGQKWGKKIKAELDAAKCVIVVWTCASVAADQTYASEWVENEADSGHRRGVLVPALLDEGRIAWTHQKVQFAELVGWHCEADHPGLAALIEGVTQYAGTRARPEEIELAAWQNAERAETGQAFRDFLAAYPQSRFAAIAAGRAAELEEAVAWGALGPAPTIATLAVFVRRYPSGRFADEAEAKIKALEHASSVRQTRAKPQAPLGDAQPSAARRVRLYRTTLLIGGAIALASVLVVIGFSVLRWLPTKGVETAEQQTQISEPAQQDAAFSDARTTPARTRAPVVSNPAGLPDHALFRECEGCPEMVVIPAGQIRMIGPMGEERRKVVGDIRRAEPVTVNVERFAIARTETTWSEWSACVAAGACDEGPVDRAGGDNGWGRGRRPVIHVTRDDAMLLARFVELEVSRERTSASVRGLYRLPSEAEWQHAAQSGAASPFSWGYDSGLATRYAWFGSNSGGQTHPVGEKAANPFGLLDMDGNVWEWVADCVFAQGYGEPPPDQTTGNCNSALASGGAWNSASTEDFGGTAGLPADTRAFQIGFRLARDL